MYSNNMNSTTENIWNKSFNKGSTLNTEANNTQTDMNIDMIGFDDSFMWANEVVDMYKTFT